MRSAKLLRSGLIRLCSKAHIRHGMDFHLRPASTLVSSQRSSEAYLPFRRTNGLRCFATGDSYVMDVPAMGDSITEGVIVSWEKAVGDYVAEDEVFCVIETDKVSVDIRAQPPGGILTECLAQEDDTVDVGAPLAKFTEADAPAVTAAPPQDEPAAPVTTTPAPKQAPVNTAPAVSPGPTAAPPAVPVAEASVTDRAERRVKMTPMRKKIASVLVEAQATAALLTTFNEVDMTDLMDMRSTYKERFEQVHGTKLSFTSAWIKAASAALQELPAVNALIDPETKEIIYRDYVDISVAVASPRGLVTPVVRNCHSMSFAEVERELNALTKKAMDDKIALEDIAGGTFSITNGGVFGSLMSTPMLNMPQSAILGLHAIKPRAVVVDGQVAVRKMMYVALTYDHRIIDGRESVTFLKSIKEKIEDPRRLLLGV